MIIGGVILAAILFTSVYYYFYVIMQGQMIRGETDQKIEQLESTKKLEQLQSIPFENQTTHTINVKVKNTGSIPVNLAYVVVYNDQSIPVDSDSTTTKTNIGLNPSHELVFDTGMPANTITTYRIDTITERGNVVTAQWPDDAASNGSDNNVYISNTASAFGSLQLDFKSLGVIFHDRASVHEPTIREGVDQRGWEVKFGSTNGYPAFLLPGDATSSSNPTNPESIVLRVRNIDPSGEDMLLHATTGLGITLASNNANQNPVVFLCFKSGSSLVPYKEAPGKQIILPNALVKGLNDESTWTYLYFCDGVPGTTTGHDTITKWQAKKFPVDLNPIIMTARGEFLESFQQYGQTFPYQAVTVTYDSFTACLKSGEKMTLSMACPSTQLDNYKGPPGDEVWVYYVTPSGTDPSQDITVLWLTNDGQVKKLTNPTESSNPFKVTIPADASSGDYILQVIDENRNIDSMTYHVQ